jgi:hypothetical protein
VLNYRLQVEILIYRQCSTAERQITRYDKALRDITQPQLQDRPVHRPHLAGRGGDWHMGSANTEGTRENVRMHRIHKSAGLNTLVVMMDFAEREALAKEKARVFKAKRCRCPPSREHVRGRQRGVGHCHAIGHVKPDEIGPQRDPGNTTDGATNTSRT